MNNEKDQCFVRPKKHLKRDKGEKKKNNDHKYIQFEKEEK